MLSRYEIQKILKLLRREVHPAVGCNEPLMLAFACAKACEVLGMEPEKVSARVSGHIIKYAMGVGIHKARINGIVAIIQYLCVFPFHLHGNLFGSQIPNNAIHYYHGFHIRLICVQCHNVP